VTDGGVVSVITPVHPAKAQFLDEAWESLAGQEMPPGWAWQWVVQEDGTAAELAGRMPDDKRVSYAAGRAGGPAVARTIAIARADGDLIKVLDADDVLAPGALARDIAVLCEHPDVGWTTSRAPNLLPDGLLDPYCCNPTPGRIERGSFIEDRPADDYEPPVHPATLCVRRGLLLMIGGWMALPASEDTGLLLALNAVSPGYFIGETGLWHRRWDGQSTEGPHHADDTERSARLRVVHQRAEALAHAFEATRTHLVGRSEIV
jgi:glycosyltransferase involved in cell wall biosynthesis